jgi:uroporphyrinogen-III synthase
MRAMELSHSTAAWALVSLRPSGEHAVLRRAAASAGGRVIALSPWRLRARDDDASRRALALALAAERVLFTSPGAALAASQLQTLRPITGQTWLAVGAGTAAALRRAGVADVLAPARMDSEGLLALPALNGLQGLRVGLVTAPGGRGMLAPALAERGARILRADVYERVPIALSASAIAKIRTLPLPAALAVSSGEALARVMAALPEAALVRLRDRRQRKARSNGAGGRVPGCRARGRTAATADGRCIRSPRASPTQPCLTGQRLHARHEAGHACPHPHRAHPRNRPEVPRSPQGRSAR